MATANQEVKKDSKQEEECSWCNIVKLVAGGVAIAGAAGSIGYYMGQREQKAEDMIFGARM